MAGENAGNTELVALRELMPAFKGVDKAISHVEYELRPLLTTPVADLTAQVGNY